MALRVLVVEDSPVARIMLQGMLELRGHEMVAEADSKDSALEAYRNHKPDLVTLDLSLGEDSGFDVLKALREIDGNARVLVISGNSQQGILDQAKAAGACGFITKPFNINDLEAAITRAKIP